MMNPAINVRIQNAILKLPMSPAKHLAFFLKLKNKKTTLAKIGKMIKSGAKISNFSFTKYKVTIATILYNLLIPLIPSIKL